MTIHQDPPVAVRRLTLTITITDIDDNSILAPYIELALRKYIAGLRVPPFSSPEIQKLGNANFEEFEFRTNHGGLVHVEAEHSYPEEEA